MVIDVDKKNPDEDYALFRIFARFMWREVDVVAEHDLPDLRLDDGGVPDFVIDDEHDITYRPDPTSLNNRQLLRELEAEAAKHGLKISLDFPNNQLIYDIEPNLVDIPVARDTDGRWRIQPDFSLR